MRHNRSNGPIGCILQTGWLLLLALGLVPAAHSAGVFDIRDYGATGDGAMLDTPAIQKAVEACAATGGGQVLFSAGQIPLRNYTCQEPRYAVSRSGRNADEHQESRSVSASDTSCALPEAKWGKWHSALILAHGVEDIAIGGQGFIDGNKVLEATGVSGPLVLNGVNKFEVHE